MAHKQPKAVCSWARKQTRCRQRLLHRQVGYRSQGSKTMVKSSSSARRSWTLTSVEMTFSTHSSQQPLRNLISLSSACSARKMLAKRKLHQTNFKRSIVIRSSWALRPPEAHLFLPITLQAVTKTRFLTNRLRNAYVSLEIGKPFLVPISRTTMHTTLRCSPDSRH